MKLHVHMSICLNAFVLVDVDETNNRIVFGLPVPIKEMGSSSITRLDGAGIAEPVDKEFSELVSNRVVQYLIGLVQERVGTLNTAGQKPIELAVTQPGAKA